MLLAEEVVADPKPPVLTSSLPEAAPNIPPALGASVDEDAAPKSPPALGGSACLAPNPGVSPAFAPAPKAPNAFSLTSYFYGVASFVGAPPPNKELDGAVLSVAGFLACPKLAKLPEESFPSDFAPNRPPPAGAEVLWLGYADGAFAVDAPPKRPPAGLASVAPDGAPKLTPAVLVLLAGPPKRLPPAGAEELPNNPPPPGALPELAPPPNNAMISIDNKEL